MSSPERSLIAAEGRGAPSSGAGFLARVRRMARWSALLLASLPATAQDRPQDNVCKLCHQVTTARAAAAKDPKITSHAQLACVDCHAALASFDPTGDDHEVPLAKVDCAQCHAAQRDALAGSIHGAKAVECKQCHVPHSIGLPLPAEIPRSARAGSCGECHEAAAAKWAGSPHAGDPGNGHAAAKCSDCHGAHDVRAQSDPHSRVYPLNLPDTCEACHKPNPSPEHPAPFGEQVSQYETSVHGRALRKDGLIVTATCASCHGGHDIRKPDDAESPVSRRNVPNTCGACHAGILHDYLGGVHGKDFAAGSTDVPVCNDCHREHAIQDPALGGSTVSAALVAETCARCHSDDELAQRYGFKSSVRSSWGDSYHGIASSLGEKRAANCASCHGFHAILPSSDPRSPVNAANLDKTCGTCHPGAGEAFSRVPVHSVVEQQANFIPWIVKTVYAVLVGALIGGFVLLILIDLWGRLRRRLRWGPPETEHVSHADWADEDRLVSPTESFRRMGYHARLQHVVLMTSFLLLVVTGLPVFLHAVPWMRDVIDLQGGFQWRSKLHRVGALTLIGLSAWHLAILAMVPSARRWFALMMFRPRDITDFLQEVLFNVGCFGWIARSPRMAKLVARFSWLRFDRRPCVGRYGLVEKLEYGAVLWGNGVMIATGAILWKPDWFLDWTPSWTFDVCRVVHGFEATLAFLAIIIWHMYHVHLRPGVFPMSRVWIDGKISREELRHHHPAEYLAILEARRTAARSSARSSEKEQEHTHA